MIKHYKLKPFIKLQRFLARHAMSYTHEMTQLYAVQTIKYKIIVKSFILHQFSNFQRRNNVAGLLSLCSIRSHRLQHGLSPSSS